MIAKHYAGENERASESDAEKLKRLEAIVERLKVSLKLLNHDIASALAAIKMIIDECELDAELAHMLRQNIELASTITRALTSENPELCSFDDLHLLMREAVTQVGQANPAFSALDIRIHPRWEHAPDLSIITSEQQWTCILKNLLENAERKGATRIGIVLQAHPDDDRPSAVHIAVEDNGRGMRDDILQKVRSGREVTDKSDVERRNERKHVSGIALQSIRMLIERVYGGSMDVESRFIDEHPDDHGTSFSFILPAYAPPQPAASRTFTRRCMMQMIGSGVVAAAGAVILHNKMTDEGEAVPAISLPLTDVQLDERGHLASFVWHAPDASIRYARGEQSRAWTEIRAERGSIIALHPHVVQGGRMRNGYVYAVPEGILANVDIPGEDGAVRAWICAALQGLDSSVPVSLTASANLYPLTDAYHGRERLGTNMRLLQSDDLRRMLSSLQAMLLELGGDDERVSPGTRREAVAHLRNIVRMAEAYVRIHDRGDGMLLAVGERFEAGEHP